jgi:hypothetical protein
MTRELCSGRRTVTHRQDLHPATAIEIRQHDPDRDGGARHYHRALIDNGAFQCVACPIGSRT